MRPLLHFAKLIALLTAVVLYAQSSVASAYCVERRVWVESDEPFIPVYVLDHPTRGLNESTLGDFLTRDIVTGHLLGAIQRWNEAGTGAKRLVFAGFITDPDPCHWKDYSVTVVALPSDQIGHANGQFRFLDSELNDDESDNCPELVEPATYRGRLALRHDDSLWSSWSTNPDLRPTVTIRHDIQSTLTHELGHVLGVGHPWLAADRESIQPEAARNRCSIAQGPAGVTPGATFGTMTYLSEVGLDDGFSSKYPRQGVRRWPWRDDIEGVTVAEGQRWVVDETCRDAADCTGCPDEDPDCDTDELSCIKGATADRACTDNVDCEGPQTCKENGTCTSTCEVDAHCPIPGEFCEKAVYNISGDGTGLKYCPEDGGCKSGQSCDAQSGLCVSDVGSCRRRECAVGHPKTYTVSSWAASGDGHTWDGPTAVPAPGGEPGEFVATAMPPATSAADDYASRRISLATVNNDRLVEFHQAGDGAWCEELDTAIVLDGPEGKTYSPPAVASGNGRTLVAWLADEAFDHYSVKVRFAIKDSFGTEWDHFGENILPGSTKRIAVGFASGTGKFVLAYLDERFDGTVKMIDPFSGDLSAPDRLVKGAFAFWQNPLHDVGRPSCSNNHCQFPLTGAEGGLPALWAIGQVDAEGFHPDDLGEPGYFAGHTNAGRGASAMRGTDDNRKRWFAHHAWSPLEPGSLRWEEFVLDDGSGVLPLPYFDSNSGPGLSSTDNSPDWSGDIGTYAGPNSGDSQRAWVFRAQGDGLPGPYSGAEVACCTESECEPIPPDEDVELDDCADLETDAGEVGCPCLPISTSPTDLESCALAGFGPQADEACQPVIPDGRFPNLYCPDAEFGVVCDETQAGNSICKSCGVGGGGTFGCPCDEVECDFEGLECWGEGFGTAPPNPHLGRCWEIESPPDHACVEVCETLQPAQDGYQLVCVGPHLGDQFDDGSVYRWQAGQLENHPSYCTSIDCADPEDLTIVGGYCEESSSGTMVCVAEDTCGQECLSNEDCASRGYPDWYVCIQDGVNRCLPL